MKSIEKKSTSNSYLNNRIALNAQFQKVNFILWQKKVYDRILSKFFKEKTGIKILDIGCGTGMQTNIFTKFFKNPLIMNLDKSQKSLLELKKKHINKNIKIKRMDIDDIKKNYFQKSLPKENFDLIHSSYSLYYSKNPKKLLDDLFKLLLKDGVLIVSAPDEPHEMVNFINKNSKVPLKVINTIKFFRKVLIPFLIKKSKKIQIYKKKNILKFNDSKSFIKFWKSTTYYNPKYLKKIENCLHRRKNLAFTKISSIATIKKIS